jgi:hypothetical protein
MVTTTATALATATKVEGNVWVTWQLLAAAGGDGWWRQISSSLSADFFNGTYFRCLWGYMQKYWKPQYPLPLRLFS